MEAVEGVVVYFHTRICEEYKIVAEDGELKYWFVYPDKFSVAFSSFSPKHNMPAENACGNEKDTKKEPPSSYEHSYRYV